MEILPLKPFTLLDEIGITNDRICFDGIADFEFW